LRTEFDIVGSFNKQPIKSFDSQRTVNLFEYTDTEGKRGKILINTSGLIFKGQVNSVRNGWRQGFIFNGYVYFVVDDIAYRMTTDLVPNVIGMLSTNNGFVAIEANTHQVIFVDGINGYIFDTTTGIFTTIERTGSAAGFPAHPVDVAFLDGFFVVPDGETNTFTLSALNDGTMWDALNSAAINSHPGTITAVQTLHRKLFIYSQFFCEVWENAGLSDFPFRRNNSLLMEYGTISPAAVVTGFDRMFFLSQDRDGLGHVIMVSGTQAIRISNAALDYQLNQYTDISDAAGIVYQDWGIIFFRLNFTIADKTWVFNVTQSTPEDLRWHNEEMLDGSRHIAQVHFYLNGQHYFGSYDNGKFYLISNTTYNNDGEAIKRERIGRLFYDPAGNRLRVDRLFLDVVQGVATESGIDANPVIFLAISRDGGRTYGNELTMPMGKIGQTDYRTFFRRLGTGKTFTFRVRFYNQTEFILLGASIDYEVLPE